MEAVIFVGPKGAGKDTCADILKEEKKITKTVSFALPLKRICSEVFELPMTYFTDVVFKEKELKEPITVTVKHLRKIKDLMVTYVDPYEEGRYYNLNRATTKLVGSVLKTPRKILQVIGTEFIRDEIHPDWHCMAAFSEKNLQKVLKDSRNVVIAVTDCRFSNEFTFLFNQFPNAKWYYVNRKKAEKELAKTDHRSESEVLKVKEALLQIGGEVIENNKGLDELKEKLSTIELPTVSKEANKKGSRFKWKQIG